MGKEMRILYRGERGGRRSSSNSREVMHRELTTLDQTENAFEPSRIPRKSECGARDETEGRQACDISQIQILEFFVIRDIQKTGAGFNSRLWRFSHCCAVLLLKFGSRIS